MLILITSTLFKLVDYKSPLNLYKNILATNALFYTIYIVFLQNKRGYSIYKDRIPSFIVRRIGMTKPPVKLGVGKNS